MVVVKLHCVIKWINIGTVISFSYWVVSYEWHIHVCVKTDALHVFGRGFMTLQEDRMNGSNLL